MFRDLLSLIASETEGGRILEEAGAIHELDRHFTFTSFQESARLSAARLGSAGLSGVEILQAPADGRSLFGDWMMPLAWEVTEATFDVITAAGRVDRVADRAQLPTCLAMWSAPTPSDGVEGDIVWVPDAADPAGYPPEGVRGKIVFTSGHPAQAKRLVSERGGVGLLSEFLHGNARLPDAVAWINAWSDGPGGWAFHATDTPAWAFLVSPRQGEQLRARLAAGERLRGRAVVASSLGPGTLPAVTAAIPGSLKQEVLVLGHQFEQGAIDNASGVAIMIEAMRVLQRLISAGKLPAPLRTIRCLFVSECYTTLYWVETSPSARRTIAGLCLDSPAGAVELMARPLELHANPHSQMSYTDALLAAIMRQAMASLPNYPWGEVAFGMTDNLVADPSIGIPCPWLGAHSRTWHTSADTMELLGAQQLAVMAHLTAAYLYAIANSGAEEALDFAYLAAARGKAALAGAGAAELARAGRADLDDAMLQLAYLAERQAEAVGSVLHLVPPAERSRLRPQVRGLQRDLRRAGAAEAEALARRAGRPGHQPTKHEPEGPLAALRPRRLIKGPLALDRVPMEERGGRPDPRWSSALFSVLSWCDGKRSLAEACHLAARELRRDRTLSADELARQFDPEGSMLGYFDFLRHHGYVAW